MSLHSSDQLIKCNMQLYTPAFVVGLWFGGGGGQVFLCYEVDTLGLQII